MNWQEQLPAEHSEYTQRLHLEEIEDKQQKRKHEAELQAFRDKLFKLLSIAIASMFIAGYVFLGFTLQHPNPYSLAAAGLATLTPLILSLALARFLFGNNKDKEERNIPSLIITFFIEVRKLMSDYFKMKKDGA